MKSIKREIDAPFSPQQLFDLVADVESYPKFLPYCEYVTIQGRDDTGGVSLLLADMQVGFGPIRQSYTSKVVLNHQALLIDVQAISGPFKVLTNQWCFTPVASGKGEICHVEFALDYEFASKSFQVLAGNVADRAFQKYVDAFMDRAKSIYA